MHHSLFDIETIKIPIIWYKSFTSTNLIILTKIFNVKKNCNEQHTSLFCIKIDGFCKRRQS